MYTNDQSLSIKDLTISSLFVGLTAALGYVVIPLPFSPVPITGQTLGVMLAGSLLSKKPAILSMCTLLLLGIIGIPVFAGGSSGIGIILGPTGGYLLSWPFAVYFISIITSSKVAYLSITKKYFLGNFIGGILIIYFFGVMQLSLLTNLTIKQAFISGALPFLFGDFIKVLTASFLSMKLQQIIYKKPPS